MFFEVLVSLLGKHGVAIRDVNVTETGVVKIDIDFSEHDKVFEDKIEELEKRIQELDTIDSIRIDEKRELERRIAELESKETEKPTKINLNETIKVKLTPYGA